MPAFASPILVTEDSARQLERIDLRSHKENFSEEWLQKHLFRHPESLPVLEIEPNLGPLVSLCMEMGSTNGYMDNVYVTPSGQIVMAEVKLWRNNESRRAVLAQVLDYAQALTTWTYEDLAREVAKATKRGPEYLIDAVRDFQAARGQPFDEAAFVDNINLNLRTGDLLLLIVGDGIRTGVESLVGFLNNFGTMRFNLGMIEVAAYRIGESILLQPRVLAKTQVVIREIKEPVTRRPYAEYAAPGAIGQTLPNEAISTDEARQKQPISEQRRVYEQEWLPAFWATFLDRLRLDDTSQPTPPRVPRSTNAMFPMPPNATYNWLSVYLARSQGSAGVALVFASTYDKRQEVYEALYAQRETIEKEIGSGLSWGRSSGALRIDWETSMGDWQSANDQARLQDLLVDYTNRFVNAFRPRITAILQVIDLV